jgi:hypothetical protein
MNILKKISVQNLSFLTATIFVLSFTILNYDSSNFTFWNASLTFGLLLVFAGLIFHFSKQKLGPWLDLIFAGIIAGILFAIWPHTFFDDAGFILRYLENTKQGVWFRFNSDELPVYGISGFIHGLFCSVLVFLGGVSPSIALHASNLTGLFITAFLLVRIFRRLLPDSKFHFVYATIILMYSKYLCDVLFQGMETPLHIAIVLMALHELLMQRSKSFFLFAAISIISKLDAVPVIAVLFVVYFTDLILKEKFIDIFRKRFKPFLLYFLFPLAVWILFSYYFFGSPLPQSAKAKLMYHSGSIQSTFPFLEIFINDPFRMPLLILLGLFLILHLFLAKIKGIKFITFNFIFGWMFIALMVLFHFYNPNERMLWYYALPDLLLISQCVLSFGILASAKLPFFDFARNTFFALCLITFFKYDTDGAKNWMFGYLGRVERERNEVGKYVAQLGNKSDTLLAWHGLTSHPFPGFVIDGTGLNSKLALSYRLDSDSLISELNPRFIVQVANDFLVERFSKHSYNIVGMFGDITLDNTEPWLVWSKVNESKSQKLATVVPKANLIQGNQVENVPFFKAFGNRIEFSCSSGKALPKTLWFVLESNEQNQNIACEIWSGDTLLKSERVSLLAKGQNQGPSIFTQSFSINLANCSFESDSFQVKIATSIPEEPLKLICPIVEYSFETEQYIGH